MSKMQKEPAGRFRYTAEGKAPRAAKPLGKRILSFFSSTKPGPEECALTERLVQGAQERTEISQKLRESEPKPRVISAEEGEILRLMRKGKYEKAAKKADEYGFTDLMNDAALALVRNQMARGLFASAARNAMEYGFNVLAAEAAFFWAKSAPNSVPPDNVAATLLEMEFYRSKPNGKAFALWEALEKTKSRLGNHVIAASIAKRYENVSSGPYREKLSRLKTELALEMAKTCMESGNLPALRMVAKEFGLSTSDPRLRKPALKLAQSYIREGKYKPADKLESLFNFSELEMRNIVSGAMEENLRCGLYKRVMETAKHYEYLSEGRGFPAQEKLARYMELGFMVKEGKPLKAAKKARGYGMFAFAEEAAAKAVEERIMDRDYEGAGRMATKSGLKGGRFLKAAKSAAASSMELGEHYTSALICRHFGFEKMLEAAVSAMVEAHKAQGYRGEISAFYTAEQFGIKSLMKEAGAELSAKEIAAGLYRRADRRNRECGFTPKELKAIAVRAIGLNLSDPKFFPMRFAAKTARKYSITKREAGEEAIRVMGICTNDGRTGEEREIFKRFIRFEAKAYQ